MFLLDWALDGAAAHSKERNLKCWLSYWHSYCTCATTINTAPLGSTFNREFDYSLGQGHKQPNPRRKTLLNLSILIKKLLQRGHAIMLNMDANSTLPINQSLLEFLWDTGLDDLHTNQPAPSTYIGSDQCRIDFMFGCQLVRTAQRRSGTLSYLHSPQADHHGLLFIDLDPMVLFGIPRLSLPAVTPPPKLPTSTTIIQSWTCPGLW